MAIAPHLCSLNFHLQGSIKILNCDKLNPLVIILRFSNNNEVISSGRKVYLIIISSHKSFSKGNLFRTSGLLLQSPTNVIGS